MAQRQPRHGIPVHLSDAQFDEFVLPHLTRGHRGPMPKFPLRKIFYYILKMLYLGCLEGAVDRQGSGRSPRNSSQERLPHSPALDSGWLSECHTTQFGMQTVSGPAPRYVRHSRRWHDNSGKKSGDNLRKPHPVIAKTLGWVSSQLSWGTLRLHAPRTTTNWRNRFSPRRSRW